MRDLPLIEATYTDLANVLDSRQDEARDRSDLSTISRIEKKRLAHDSAYFVLAWGQLELKVNEECVKAIIKRKSSPNWEVRRAWDAHNEGDLRARFEDRVALLVDRASESYREILTLYRQRNRVAHGRSLATGIDVPTVIGRIYRMAGELKP